MPENGNEAAMEPPGPSRPATSSRQRCHRNKRERSRLTSVTAPDADVCTLNHRRILAQDHCPLQHVLQLADVTWPVVIVHLSNRICRELLTRTMLSLAFAQPFR